MYCSNFVEVVQQATVVDGPYVGYGLVLDFIDKNKALSDHFLPKSSMLSTSVRISV